MDFSLDDAHQAVADLVADVLGRGDDAWPALAKAGLLSLALPPAVGGDGLGVLATSLVLTELGRHALPVATMTLAVQSVITDQNLLLQIADGVATLSVALNEPGDPLPTAPRTVADDAGVTGVKTGVLAADRILVSTAAGVVLVDPRADGVDLTNGRLRLIHVTAQPLDVSVVGLNSLAVAGACAYADGLLAGALDLTASHIRTREQFGRPLATFQAVAHQIADVSIAARTLHLATRAACWRLDAGLPADTDLAVAAYWLAAELLPAMHTCHHLHGGIGLDITYPMHRYYAQAKELTRFVGGVDPSLDRVGEAICSSN